jgi:hypothetical protein
MWMSTNRSGGRLALHINRDIVAGQAFKRSVKTDFRLIEGGAEPVAGHSPVTGIAAGRDRELAVMKARVRWLALVEQAYGAAAADLAKARFRSYRIETDGEAYVCLFRATPTCA